ncbi:MAG: nuclear transport factor 2 family protein [Actinobacteria bacterium]|nr:MAG: nuclear transport factor 2 family protein [Actinomycetota bacterium]
MDTPSDISAWIDKLAIEETIIRYSDAATRGAWDEFEALWTRDARVVGARAIRESVISSLEGEDFLVQMTHGSVITLHSETHASATTTIHAIARRQGEHDVANYGIYYDELAKVDGVWKFAQRRLQPIYSDFSPLPGIAPISRDELAELR